MLSYVWPDQAARLARLRGAIEVARRVPATLERRTAADAVGRLSLAEGALTVLWHSITWQYLSAGERAAVCAGVDALGARAGASAPLVHLNGGPRVLAQCHPHGPPVDWL